MEKMRRILLAAALYYAGRGNRPRLPSLSPKTLPIIALKLFKENSLQICLKTAAKVKEMI